MARVAHVCVLFAGLSLWVWGAGAHANSNSLYRSSVVAPERGALIKLKRQSGDVSGIHGASLFQNAPVASLFKSPSRRSLLERAPVQLGRHGSQVDRLRYIIGRAESYHDGYDAVQHGARIKPPRRPTQMTIGEIYDWIDATPHQPHAIGRYQFIPKTLRRVVQILGAKRHERFTPKLQDRLADVLLVEAGLDKIKAGALGRREFMFNLAKIWAGLPTPSGRSYYHGFAGNKATVSWAYFDSEMGKIFPG